MKEDEDSRTHSKSLLSVLLGEPPNDIEICRCVSKGTLNFEIQQQHLEHVSAFRACSAPIS